MKKIYYTDHLKLRLKFRKIPYELPKKIYQTSKERYFDKETDNFVAIKSINHKGKVRELVLVYEETLKEISLITVHPLKKYQKISRIKLGRWKKL